MSITITGIFIILILLFFIIYGMKMGLVKAVFDLLAFFITWLVTWAFYPKLAALLIKTDLYDSINKWIIATLSNNDSLSISLPEFFINLPDFIKDSIITSSKQAFESLINSTSEALTVLSINIISFIALFFVVRLFALLIKKTGRKINKVLLIGPINTILGGAFGAIQGLLMIYLIVMIISYFPTTKIYDRVANDIKVSYICKKMFNKDIRILGINPRYPMIRGD